MGKLEERTVGSSTVLFGNEQGKYPDANSLLVRGSEETVLIDPALGVGSRLKGEGENGALGHVDRVLLTHCHEDHLSGLFLFPETPCELHVADAPGMASIDAMMEIYGLPEPRSAIFRKAVLERFHYVPRPDALPFRDGAVWDLGGQVRVRAVHAPGHTRGHCLFHVEPDDLLFIADVDLSGFGPYYGDAWSSLEDWRQSLDDLSAMQARYYLTSHHKGMLENGTDFDAALRRYAAVIDDRERRLLEFLDEPRTMEEIVEHRFVYRPQDAPETAHSERRHMTQHVERLLERGSIEKLEGERYRRAP